MDRFIWKTVRRQRLAECLAEPLNLHELKSEDRQRRIAVALRMAGNPDTAPDIMVLVRRVLMAPGFGGD